MLMLQGHGMLGVGFFGCYGGNEYSFLEWDDLYRIVKELIYVYICVCIGLI